MALITLADIQAAQGRLQGVAYHTPLLPVHGEAGLYFKPESLQPIGSFKLRGAYNKIASLSATERAQGVIAYSSGNHAQGVAYAARALGIKAVVVMPDNAPQVKIANTRAYGAEVVLYNHLTEKREAVTAALQAEHGYALVPPYNDLHIIAGQGTMGAEIAADLPDVDLVLAPVGGGGMLSGLATALKHLRPQAQVWGVEPNLAADAQASLQAGHIVSISAQEAQRTLADGVRTLALGDLTFAHVQAYAAGIVTVTEDELRAAFQRIVLEHKLWIEPTAALPLAAWLFHRHELPPARQIVLILSGGSVDPDQAAGLLKAT